MVKDNLLIKYRDNTFEKIKIANTTINYIYFHLNNYHGRFYAKEYTEAFKISRVATTTNRSEIDISNITDSRDIQICMFVAISEDHYLDVLIDSGNKTVNKTTVVGFIRTKSELLFWKKLEIAVSNYNGTGRLFFIRRKLFENTTTGFWALDFIHVCRPKIDFYHSKRTLLHTENNICRILDRTHFNSNIFCKKKGYLGQHCNISCTDVLGNSNPSCRNYTICSENGTCQCAYGYQGQFCEEEKEEEEKVEQEVFRNFLDAIGVLNSLLLLYSMFILLGICILGFVLYRFKFNKFPFNAHQLTKNQNKTEDVVLIDRQNTNIAINNFEDYVKDLCSENSSRLSEQFNLLKQEDTKTCAKSLRTRKVAKIKNQKNLSTPTEVHLKKLQTLGTDKHIEASFLDGYSRPKTYIVCESPKFSTVGNFWRMIWQENVRTVVMATNFVENDQRMCAEYWNAGVNTIFECGDLNIRLTHEDLYEHYEVRTFEIFYTRYRREIQHFQLKWNSSCEEPLYPNEFAPVLNRVNKISQISETPIVIHSGLGSNVTGVLILCDLALHMAKSKQQIDVYQLLKTMNAQKSNLIDKKECYLLAHLVVLESLLERENPFKKSLQDNLISSVIEEQVIFLNRMNEYDSIVTTWIPPKSTDDILQPIFVDGYQHSKKFIILKQLTNKIVGEFWKFVASEKIKFIIFINPCKVKLFPYTTKDPSSVMKVSQVDSTHSTASYSLDKLLQLIYDNSTKQVLYENEISCFSFHDWEMSRVLPKTFQNMLEMISNIKKTCNDQDRILITSRNGFDSSCLVVAIFYILKKYEKELETDAYNVLRTVKRSNCKFFSNCNQLNYLYSALIEYFKDFDKYNHVEI